MKLGRIDIGDGLEWVVMTVGKENSHIVPNECGYICIPVDDLDAIRECDLWTFIQNAAASAKLIHQLSQDYPEVN